MADADAEARAVAEIASAARSDLHKVECALDAISDCSANVERLPLIERAHIYAQLAFAVSSLAFYNLTVFGADTENHRIMSSIARVRTYMSKVREAEQSLKDETKAT